MHLKKHFSISKFIFTILQVAAFFNNGHTINNISSVMFSNSALNEYTNIFRNTSYINPLEDPNEITRVYYDTSNLQTLVNTKPNYFSYSFESSSDFYSCKEIYGIFNNVSSYVMSNSILDCEQFILNSRITNSLNTDPNSYHLKILTNSATAFQIFKAANPLIKEFKLHKYAIIYGNIEKTFSRIDYFKQFADDFSHKLSLDSKDASMLFKAAINDVNLNKLVNKNIDNLNVIFLLLECGQESIFFNNNEIVSKLHSKKIPIVAIYSSSLCLSMVNYNLNVTHFSNAYEHFFKLVPVDLSQNNFETTTSILTNLIYKNLTDYNVILNGLKELEDYFILKSCYANDCYLKNVDLIQLNQSIVYECLPNQTIAGFNNTILSYYRRHFKFILFRYETDSFVNIANIKLPHLIEFATDKEAGLERLVDFRMGYAGSENSTSPIDQSIIIYGLIIVSVLVLFGLVIIGYFIRSRMMQKELSKGPNKIILKAEDLEFDMNSMPILNSRTTLRESDCNTEVEPEESLISDELTKPRVAKYKGDICIIKYLRIKNFSLKNSTMRELKNLRDVRHENVNAFLGLYTDLKVSSLVYEYATRGSLQDVIKKKETNLDWNFKWSMLNDLCRGMRYIHQSPLKYHGFLKSSNCVVDSRWVLKITDFGLLQVYANQKATRPMKYSQLLWTAPEHLKQAIPVDHGMIITTGSQLGDIYAFGIIMQEVILRGAPFCMTELTSKEIIAKIKKSPPLFRPSVSKTAAPPEYVNIMRECWSEQAEIRPNFDQLHSMFKSLNGEKKVNLVDLMLKMIEQYTNNLEELIREKTIKLEEEKKNTERLLSEMLPPSVAEALKLGNTVPPETFDNVTIYFSDIVGFTTISHYSSPIEVVQLLNDLYTLFDEILSGYDAYKVETIGDAYMVVSGLPIRNGNRHAGEIATFALDLLHNCGKFQIKHLPGVPLRLRIGIHSGACVAGVVGLKMPRYCLFGDTVNTASRMESTSHAYRIHVSETSTKILQDIGGYHLEPRGITKLAGKGSQKTCWLTGKEGFDRELPTPFDSENNHCIFQFFTIHVFPRTTIPRVTIPRVTIPCVIQIFI